MSPTESKAVLLIGDSNAYRSAPHAPSCFAIEGHPGYTAAHPIWETAIPQNIETYDPQVAIVQLGTNDALYLSATRAFRASVDKIMSLLAPLPVHWNLVRAARRDPARVRHINAVLADAEDRWDNLTVEALPAHFHGHPEWIPAYHVHFTPEGYVELGRFNLENSGIDC